MPKYMLAGLIILCVTGTACFSQTDTAAAKRAKIIKLLDLTGSLKFGAMFGNDVVEQVCDGAKKNGTVVSDSLKGALQAQAKTMLDSMMRARAGIVDQLCAIYGTYYSEKDVDELLKFYGSKTGKKVIETLPSIMQESMAAGQKWSIQNGPVIMNRLRDRLPQPSQNPAPGNEKKPNVKR